MTNISGEFLKPNKDDRYYAQQSQVFRGLWTPYGLISPMFIGAWPDGTIMITYTMHRGAQFAKIQKRKIKFVKKRGVEVSVMYNEEMNTDAET